MNHTQKEESEAPSAKCDIQEMTFDAKKVRF
jgi:hypothetical protein